MNVEKHIEDFFRDLEYMWEPAAPQPPQERYKTPTNLYALQIWRECGLRYTESENTIHIALEIWAQSRQLLVPKDGVLWIRWKHNTTRFESKWDTFKKWFLCACD